MASPTTDEYSIRATALLTHLARLPKYAGRPNWLLKRDPTKEDDLAQAQTPGKQLLHLIQKGELTSITLESGTAHVFLNRLNGRKSEAQVTLDPAAWKHLLSGVSPEALQMAEAYATTDNEVTLPGDVFVALLDKNTRPQTFLILWEMWIRRNDSELTKKRPPFPVRIDTASVTATIEEWTQKPTPYPWQKKKE